MASSAPATHSEQAGGGDPPPLWHPARILCGVDGSIGSAEAVVQAIALAGETSLVDFSLVSWSSGGRGQTAMATVSPARGQAALDQARRMAREAGVASQEHLVAGGDPGEVLVDRAADADLLVVGASHHTRAGGIIEGHVSTVAAHRSPCDVLIARRAPEGGAFPDHILLGFDGSPSAQRAARITAAIAGRHGSDVSIAAVGRSSPEERHAFGAAAAGIAEATGREPTIVIAEGDVHEKLADLAGKLGISVVFLGARRVSGVRALGSVSERVANDAPCSVLIARGDD